MTLPKLGQIQEKRVWEPTLIFEVVDSFARNGTLGTDDANASGSAALRSAHPMGKIVIEAVAKVVGGERHVYPKPMRLILRQSPSGYFLFYGRVERSKGVIQRDLRQAGVYDLRISSDYYLTTELKDVIVPMPDFKKAVTVNLIPTPAYPFPPYVKLLRGTLRDRNGNATAGVTVTTDEYPSLKYVTTDSGDWVLALPTTATSTDIQAITLRFTEPDGTSSSEVINYSSKRGERVALLKGQIVDGNNNGIPKVTVEVPNQPGGVMTDDGGNWTYVFPAVEPEMRVDAIITKKPGEDTKQRHVLGSAIPIRMGQAADTGVVKLS